MQTFSFRIRVLVALGCLLLWQPAVWCQEESSISVKAEVDQAFITIGDPVEYTVTIRHTPSIQVLSSVKPPSKDIFKIKKIDEIRREEDGLVVEGRKFTLTTFRLGEYILDPVQIEYRDKDNPNAEVKTLTAAKIYITVKSVAEGEEKVDIRGVKSVVEIAGRFGWLFILILLLLAAAGFYFYRRWRQAPVEALSDEPALSPHEEALLDLQNLFDSDWMRQGKIKEYYLRLSEILRTYFEKRFHILAIESTTYEILRSLKSHELIEPLRQKIGTVLESADLAKFAKWKPSPTETIKLNKASKEIVEESIPKQEEVPSGV